jgi:transcriptional regulator with XRE-family HTH domain
MTRKNASVRQRRVSSELRALRLAKGLSCDDVGKAVGCSESKISRMETGDRGLHADDVSAILGYLQAPPKLRQELLAMVREGEAKNWHAIHDKLPSTWQDLMRFEREANALHNYEPLLIPGLAQTSDYARAIIGGINSRLTEAEVDSLVANRMSRQVILGRKRVHLLIDEMVLRRHLDNPAMMRAQLEHLAALANRANVAVQVVPHQVAVHPGMGGPLLILDFDDQPTLVYVEGRGVSTFLEEEKHIETARVAWQRLRALALPPEESKRLIAEATAHLI